MQLPDEEMDKNQVGHADPICRCAVTSIFLWLPAAVFAEICCFLFNIGERPQAPAKMRRGHALQVFAAGQVAPIFFGAQLDDIGKIGIADATQFDEYSLSSAQSAKSPMAGSSSRQSAKITAKRHGVHSEPV